MRNIDDLIKQKKPADKMSDEEVIRRMREEDERMINTFSPLRRPERDYIGKRPWT